MKVIIFILSIILFQVRNVFEEQKDERYEKIIKEKISEKYYNEVIDNLVSIIDEIYVYNDFLKAPKQAEGYEDYIPKIDLIQGLKNINTKDASFFDFYRDIKNVLNEARDAHFSLNFKDNSPLRELGFSNYTFCIPFKYIINEEYDEEI